MEEREIKIYQYFDKEEFKNLRTLKVNTSMGEYVFLVKKRTDGKFFIYSNYYNGYTFKFWLDKNNNLLFSKFQDNTAKFSYELEEVTIPLYGIITKGESVLSTNINISNISMNELEYGEILYVVSEEPLTTIKFKFQNPSFLSLFSLEELIVIYTLYYLDAGEKA